MGMAGWTLRCMGWIFGGSLWSQDSMIFVGPFQCRIFYDSMTALVPSKDVRNLVQDASHPHAASLCVYCAM